jgi:DNA-binding transcriptional LysR family regulator
MSPTSQYHNLGICLKKLARTFLRVKTARLQPPARLHHLTGREIPSSADFFAAICLGLGWGMLPEPQAQASLSAGRLTQLSPDALDVPLYWQCWQLDSPRLTALTSAVRNAARSHLRPA